MTSYTDVNPTTSLTAASNQADFIISLQNLLDAYSMSMSDALQIIEMHKNRQELLALHKTPISQNEKDKRWRTRLPNGKQIVKSQRKDVEDIVIEYYREQQKSSEICTLTTLYQEWLEKRRLGKKSDNTVAKDIRMWDTYLKDNSIAQKPITTLTRADFRDWAEDIIVRYAMTKKYYKNIKSLMNSLMSYSEEKEIIEYNKFSTLKIDNSLFRPEKEHHHGEDSFSLEEEYAIMHEAELDSQNTNSAIPLGICILLLTGIRVGELAALKYGDIDGSTLHIRRMQIDKQEYIDGAMKQCGLEVVEHTKSTAGTRTVPLPPIALTYFSLIKKYNIQNGYSTTDDDYIFQRQDGMANHRCFDHRIRKYCKKLGLKYEKSCHDTRRTYISKLAQVLSLDSVREIAGHSTVDMTLKYLRNNDTSDFRSTVISDAFKDYKCNMV